MHEQRISTVTKLLAGCAIAACAAFTLPASAQVSFGLSIGAPPPPLRYEASPPMPGPGFVWTDGYWGVNHGRYIWIPGRWERPPYAGAYWTHGHWDHYPDGWHYHEGHWDREDHREHYDWHRRDDHHHDHR